MQLLKQIVLNSKEFRIGQRVEIAETADHSGEVGIITGKTGHVYTVKLNEEEILFHTADLIEAQSDKKIFNDFDEWEQACRDAHPAKQLKLKGRIEHGIKTISAEVKGEDRSYGVWNDDEGTGVVLHENVIALAHKLHEDIGLTDEWLNAIIIEGAVLDAIINVIKKMLGTEKILHTDAVTDAMVDTAKEIGENRVQSAGGPWIVKAFISSLKFGQKKFCICHPANDARGPIFYIPA